MKQLEVFKKIGGIINELHEQYKYIETNNPDNINDLELELFVANAHFLKDHAEILNKLSQRTKAEAAEAKEKVTPQLPPHAAPALPQATPPIQQPSAARLQQVAEVEQPEKPIKKNAEQVQRALEKIKALTAEKFFEPMVQQPKREAKPAEREVEEESAMIDITPAASKDTYSFEVEEPQIRHELIVDEDSELDEDEDLVEEEVADEDEIMEDSVAVRETPPVIATPELREDAEERIAIELGKAPVVAPEVAPEIKLDIKAPEPAKEKDEVFTINQRISAQLGSSNVSEHSNAQPVTNLKQAITLNDKLLYIKDLFNGYSLAYSEAIEILNRFNTFEEANRFLNKNYTVKNNWDSKPETTDKFFALLKRRYS